MGGKSIVVIIFVALALAGGGACAMNAPGHAGPHCHVIGGEKLPPDSGGSDALCAAIEKAVSAQAPGSAYTVEVRVISASRLSATLKTADGRTLPDQNFAISDRALTSASFDRFAETLAAELGKATRR